MPATKPLYRPALTNTSPSKRASNGGISTCIGCKDPIAGPVTAVKLGIKEHASHGRCTGCATLWRREQRKLAKQLEAEGNYRQLGLTAPLKLGWRVDAACGPAEANPALFKERLLKKADGGLPEDLAETAYKFCLGCPVLADCRAEADANPDMTGLWGGVYRRINPLGRRETYNLLDPDFDPYGDIR